MHDDEEEVFGEPSFELRLRDGEPLVSGCYFMHPVIEVRAAAWDDTQKDRLLVTATDGSEWYADGVSRTGRVNIVLTPMRD
ncbi:hypothetical protein ABT061_45150 [Streptosporangium sp. NPDC002544]|uniref:hypothetical protein n=1 Tax=Streptosporangium sp. NPDC002544 TaxID=3154538 RepID=UPI003330CA3A